jgi:hypothetical protein
MEGINLAPILIPLGAFLVGWLLGFLDSNMRTSKKVKIAEEKAQAAIENAEKKIEKAQIADQEALTAFPLDSVESLLKLSQDSNGQMLLELDGRHVDTSAMPAEQRKRLVAILTQIRPWLEAPKPAQPPAQARPVVSSSKGASPARAMSASTPSLSHKPTPAPSPASKPAAPATAEDDEPAAPLESIVAQIDSVLQARLVGTSLADKGVRLQESLEGGVLVWVGINKYEGIDDVPDEQIKAAIRAAITEWENKYTPGL